MRDINLILENIVYLELLRRGYEVTVGRTGDKEIDFVCDKRSEKCIIFRLKTQGKKQGSEVSFDL